MNDIRYPTGTVMTIPAEGSIWILLKDQKNKFCIVDCLILYGQVGFNNPGDIVSLCVVLDVATIIFKPQL